ncbi:ScbA/BarX family gamma-butyrolactone biosynthesis protein [Streptomyces sp. R21]|uniref:ScbA/BarX family gamma-butyrolactone biosynthesis protein n=1 Tax=Streptomyces sp. R21 TaxID=3238627 RepID=A0AB39NZ22_9ACTN
MSLPTTSRAIGLPALPRLTTTVPKEYVHRASLAEVFLTGCTARGGLRYLLTGQWPRAHTLFNSTDGTSHDPLQTAETFRQTGIYLAHAELGVPLTHRFVLSDLSYTTRPENLRITGRPTDFDLEATCTELTRRREMASWLRLELSIRRSGALVARGTGALRVIEPAVYRRLRASRTPPPPHPFDLRTHRTPLPPARVGRQAAADVMLSPTDHPTRWLLTPDLDHPILFDHSDDHLPGMVLLEGARQAATALLAPRILTPAAASTTFHRYAELDRPCWIDVLDISSPHTPRHHRPRRRPPGRPTRLHHHPHRTHPLTPPTTTPAPPQTPTPPAPPQNTPRTHPGRPPPHPARGAAGAGRPPPTGHPTPHPTPPCTPAPRPASRPTPHPARPTAGQRPHAGHPTPPCTPAPRPASRPTPHPARPTAGQRPGNGPTSGIGRRTCGPRLRVARAARAPRRTPGTGLRAARRGPGSASHAGDRASHVRHNPASHVRPRPHVPRRPRRRPRTAPATRPAPRPASPPAPHRAPRTPRPASGVRPGATVRRGPARSGASRTALPARPTAHTVGSTPQQFGNRKVCSFTGRHHPGPGRAARAPKPSPADARARQRRPDDTPSNPAATQQPGQQPGQPGRHLHDAITTPRQRLGSASAAARQRLASPPRARPAPPAVPRAAGGRGTTRRADARSPPHRPSSAPC